MSRAAEQASPPRRPNARAPKRCAPSCRGCDASRRAVASASSSSSISTSRTLPIGRRAVRRPLRFALRWRGRRRRRRGGCAPRRARRAGRLRSSAGDAPSDHGEGLGDHGEREHGVFLYREALQVPLVLKLPGARLRRNDDRRAGAAHRRGADRARAARHRGAARRLPAARSSISTGRPPRGRPARIERPRQRDISTPRPSILPSLRMERAALDDRGQPALHRGPHARALRPLRRSRRA